MSDNDSSTHAAQTIGITAQAMLDGTLHYLQGAIELERLRHLIGAYENDPDFMAFVGVMAEINSLKLDTEAADWIVRASEPQQRAIAESVAWAKAVSWSQCQALAERYAAP
jgi:hypothetical protein